MNNDFTARPADERHELYDRFMAMVSDEPVGITVDEKLAMVMMSKTAYYEMFDSKGNTDSISEHLVKMHLAYMDILNGRTISLEELSAVFCDGSEDADSDMISKSLGECAAIAEAKASLYRKLAQAEDDIRNSKVSSIDKVLTEVYEHIDSIKPSPTSEDLESRLDDEDTNSDIASETIEKSASLAEAKAELLAHLAQSRDDFRNGRLYTSEEAKAMVQACLDSIRSVNGPTAEDLEFMLNEADDAAASSADERASHDEVFGAAKKAVHRDE